MLTSSLAWSITPPTTSMGEGRFLTLRKLRVFWQKLWCLLQLSLRSFPLRKNCFISSKHEVWECSGPCVTFLHGHEIQMHPLMDHKRATSVLSEMRTVWPNLVPNGLTKTGEKQIGEAIAIFWTINDPPTLQGLSGWLRLVKLALITFLNIRCGPDKIMWQAGCGPRARVWRPLL